MLQSHKWCSFVGKFCKRYVAAASVLQMLLPPKYEDIAAVNVMDQSTVRTPPPSYNDATEELNAPSYNDTTECCEDVNAPSSSDASESSEELNAHNTAA